VGKGPQETAAVLQKVVGGEVFGDVLHRAAFSTDASIYRIVPLCVVAPRSKQDVAAVVRYAREEGISVVARGAGSGVAGESLGRGIVFDMSRHMNRIVGVYEDGAVVECEPGVVLGQLNAVLSRYGRKIGPDPSSANRATIGGCVANNATGAHSLQYGYIGQYVEAVEAVLDDGRLVELINGLAAEEAEDERVESIARECIEVIGSNEAVIQEAMPKTKRNRAGYRVAGVCREGRIDLARLVSGSEGTLAIFTKIRLRTVEVPAAKGLVQFEFASLEKMAEAVPLIVASGAVACEVMDQRLIRLAHTALAEYRDILPADAAAVLLVEHIGQSEQEVREKIAATDSAVGSLAKGRSIVLDGQQQERLWKSRKDAGPLLYRQRSRKHPAEFMEDVSVDPTRLGEYIAGLEKIGRKYDISMSFFGHAGDGELHLRPYLDLGDAAHVAKMQAVAEEVFSLAWSLGGSISGEHAVGLVRAGFLRQQYGDAYYELLRRIKNIFDPQGVMNPGKIINSDPDVMVRDLRRGRRVLPERVRTELAMGQEELALELEQCYGCGLCLSREVGARMCPVYRALGEELGSSRAKANILNFWATGLLEERQFESAEFRKFLDLCVNCKACERECPAGVDISTLMVVARAEYVRRRGLRRAERLLSVNRFVSSLGSAFAPISNWVMGTGVFRWALEKGVGLDRRRGLPRFAWGSFLRTGRRYIAESGPVAKPVDRVAYFVDTYANYNDHELGFAVVDVLRANGVEVILPKQVPVPLPAIVYGDVRRAKKDLGYIVKHLSDVVRAGYKVVCSEPSAALCLRQELGRYVTGEQARLVSENTYELMSYLLGLYQAGKFREPARVVGGQFVYHLPCHMCAIGAERASLELLRDVCKAEVVELAAGCCGLAGTFGMQQKNYELSEQIAQSLRQALEDSEVKDVLTECAACKMQIEHLGDYTVRHPVKILAAAYTEG